jgi:WD40 repeat protein
MAATNVGAGSSETPARLFSTKARLAAQVNSANRIEVTNPRSGELLAELTPPDSAKLEQLFFSSDGQRIMSVSADRLIQVWDLPRIRSQLRKLNLDWSDGPAAPAIGL